MNFFLLKRTPLFYLVATAFLVLIGTVRSGAQVHLAIQPGVALSWPTITNNIYQPQWSPSFGGSWNVLGGPVPGDGTTKSLYDPVPSGTRQYQVFEMIPGSAPSSA